MKHAMRVCSARLRFAIAVVAGVWLTLGTGEATATANRKPLVEGAPAAMGVSSALTVNAWAGSHLGRLDNAVLRLALTASRCAMSAGAVSAPRTLTIIDYSKPSVEPRLWVLDLLSRSLVYEELVAHGQGSGGNFATSFSNRAESHQSSLGLFVTTTTYVGRNGYSLRLDGLDAGFNDLARARAIVMHGASYVNAQIGTILGRLGRSHGCPAVRDAIARQLIDRVKGGNLLFAYYPDRQWLNSSRFLSCDQSSARS